MSLKELIQDTGWGVMCGQLETKKDFKKANISNIRVRIDYTPITVQQI